MCSNFKILIIAALFLSFTAIAEEKKDAPKTQQAPVVEQSKEFTIDEIAKHNNEKDCYMAIDGVVYDVTKFVSEHPGPKSKFLKNCGKDASKSFESKGGIGETHSDTAKKMMPKMVIGKVKK